MVEGVNAAGSRWVEGIKNPRRDPQQAALKATARYKEQTLKAINEGRYEQGVAAYSVDQMIATVDALGANVYTQGVATRVHKIEAAQGVLLPLMARHLATIDAMPAVTDADREARMLANMRGMKQVGTDFRKAKK
jgi:hypothetical protein